MIPVNLLFGPAAARGGTPGGASCCCWSATGSRVASLLHTVRGRVRVRGREGRVRPARHRRLATPARLQTALLRALAFILPHAGRRCRASTYAMLRTFGAAAISARSGGGGVDRALIAADDVRQPRAPVPAGPPAQRIRGVPRSREPHARRGPATRDRGAEAGPRQGCESNRGRHSAGSARIGPYLVPDSAVRADGRRDKAASIVDGYDDRLGGPCGSNCCRPATPPVPRVAARSESSRACALAQRAPRRRGMLGRLRGDRGRAARRARSRRRSHGRACGTGSRTSRARSQPRLDDGSPPSLRSRSRLDRSRRSRAAPRLDASACEYRRRRRAAIRSHSCTASRPAR